MGFGNIEGIIFIGEVIWDSFKEDVVFDEEVVSVGKGFFR